MASNGKNTRVKTIPAKPHVREYKVGQYYLNGARFKPEIFLYEILFTTNREPGRTFLVFSVLNLTDGTEEVEMDNTECYELAEAVQITKEEYLKYRIDPSGNWKEKG